MFKLLVLILWWISKRKKKNKGKSNVTERCSRYQKFYQHWSLPNVFGRHPTILIYKCNSHNNNIMMYCYHYYYSTNAITPITTTDISHLYITITIIIIIIFIIIIIIATNHLVLFYCHDILLSRSLLEKHKRERARFCRLSCVQ